MEDLKKAVELLLNGDIISVPTDTVYGIAAKADNNSAVQKVYRLKQRPISNPCTICLSKAEDLLPFLLNPSEEVERLARTFWPGALTIVVKVDQKKVLPIVRADMEFCGFRVPSSPLLLKIIEEAGPIVLPSANISTTPPLKTKKEIEDTFPGLFVMEKTSTSSEIPSTVVRVDEGIEVLREGAITKEMMEEVLSTCSSRA